MIVLSNSAAQTLAAGQSLTFDVTVTKSGCAEHHRTNSSSVQLCAKNGLYDIFFKGNVTGATAGTTVQLAMASGGDILAETVMQSTPSTEALYNNVSAKTLIRTSCCDGDNRITVINNGTTAITVGPNTALVVQRKG